MARRLIYNPADFVQASTPFYENIIGTINDQADRIARNIEKREEAEQVAEQRAFEFGMQQHRIQAQGQLQREMQEDSQEFREKQSAKERKQQNEQFNKEMEWKWASLQDERFARQQKRIAKAQEEFQGEIEDRQKRVNKMYDKLKKGGWRNPNMPEQYHVGFDPENERFTVEDRRNGEAVPFDKWVGQAEPLLGIQDALAGGDNILEWADNKLYDAQEDFGELSLEEGGQVRGDTVVDAEGNIGYGRDAVRNAIIQVRDGVDTNGKAMELLTNLANSDSKHFVLEKEDELTEFDSDRVAETVGTSRGALMSLDNFYGNLVNTAEKSLSTDLSDEELKEMFVSPVDIETSIIGGDDEEMITGKTIGELRRGQQLMKERFGTQENDVGASLFSSDQYEDIDNAINNLEDLFIQTASEYKDKMVPNELKDKPVTFLARIAKINKQEFMKDKPNPINLYDFPAQGSEEAKRLSEMDLSDLQEAFRTRIKDRDEDDRFLKKLIHGNPNYENPDPIQRKRNN